MEIPVTIKSTKELYGIYHRCENSKATVIMLHGLYGSRVDSHRLCVEFARVAYDYNISCLRVDLTGSGISQGNFMDFTFKQQITDAMNIIKWLKNQDNTNIIYLLGISDGAITAYHSGYENVDINGIIFWSPVFSQNSSNKTKTLRRLYKVGDNLAWAVSGNWLYKDYYEDKTRLIECIDFDSQKTKCFAVYGTKDNAVSKSLQEISPEYLEKYAIEDGDHVYLSPQWTDQAIEQTIRWILDNKRGTYR